MGAKNFKMFVLGARKYFTRHSDEFEHKFTSPPKHLLECKLEDYRKFRTVRLCLNWK